MDRLPSKDGAEVPVWPLRKNEERAAHDRRTTPQSSLTVIYDVKERASKLMLLGFPRLNYLPFGNPDKFVFVFYTLVLEVFYEPFCHTPISPI